MLYIYYAGEREKECFLHKESDVMFHSTMLHKNHWIPQECVPHNNCLRK